MRHMVKREKGFHDKEKRQSVQMGFQNVSYVRSTDKELKASATGIVGE